MASNFFLLLSQRTGKNKESKKSKEKERKKKWESTIEHKQSRIACWQNMMEWGTLFLQGVKLLGFQFLRIC